MREKAATIRRGQPEVGAGEPRRILHRGHRWTQRGKIQEESTAEVAEGRRENREETKYQFFSAALCGLCG
jgi:hypothetical protein